MAHRKARPNPYASRVGTADQSTAAARKHLVLGVSEDSQLLIDLWTWLASHSAVSVQIAENESTALNALNAHPVRSVVLDLRMRDLCALDLLRRFAEQQPPPSAVLVCSGEPRAAEHMLRAVGLPLMVRSCTSVSAIGEAVGLAIDGEPLRPGAITPAVLATLASTEKATCTIAFTGSPELTGALSFSNGALFDARAGNASGAEAAVRLLEAGAMSFSIDTASPVPPRSINVLVRDLLARAIVHQSGSDASSAAASRSPSPSSLSPDPGPAISAPTGADRTPEITQEKKMALESVLQQLKEIKGYKASGIMHFTGEMLAADSADPAINLAMVGATFNDIFRSAHEASKKIGLDACRETTIVTPKGIVVMACSGVDSKAHVHMIGILAADGNHSLMRMQITKLLNEAVAALA